MMRYLLVLALVSFPVTATPNAMDTPKGPAMNKTSSPLEVLRDSERFFQSFAEVTTLIPSIQAHLLYAQDDNFVSKRLYPVNAPCYAHTDLIKRLATAQAECQKLGLSLKITDAYRPYRYQQVLFDVVPDKRYVMDPKRGSNHNRGMAIDVTLVNSSGKELDMGGIIDDMSENAHRSYTHISLDAYKNRCLLETLMTRAGFTGVSCEWWHFDAPAARSYPVYDVPFEAFTQALPTPTPSAVRTSMIHTQT